MNCCIYGGKRVNRPVSEFSVPHKGVLPTHDNIESGAFALSKTRLTDSGIQPVLRCVEERLETGGHIADYIRVHIESNGVTSGKDVIKPEAESMGLHLGGAVHDC